MNLEQVKEHFKYAKEVRCAYDGVIYTIKAEEIILSDINDDFVFKNKEADYCIIYNSDTNQLAEILTYIFDCGEEVECSCAGDIWTKQYFIGFLKNRLVVCEDDKSNVTKWVKIRKLTPESLLEPQLSEFKKFAESKLNCTVTIIFENK